MSTWTSSRSSTWIRRRCRSRSSVLEAAPAASLLAIALVAGCKTDSAGASGEPAQPWFEAQAGALPATCSAAPEPLQSLKVRVDLFAAKGIDTAAARRRFARFRARAAGFGIEVTRGSDRVRSVAPATLLSTTRGELAEAVGDHPTRHQVAEYLMRPVSAFLDNYSGSPIDRINLVFVREIVAPRSAVAAHLSAVVGLTFSPASSDSAEGAELARALTVDRYRPTAFIAEAADADAMLHELGHALGLGHETARDNVMSQVRTQGCAATFSTDQLRRLESAVVRLIPSGTAPK